MELVHRTQSNTHHWDSQLRRNDRCTPFQTQIWSEIVGKHFPRLEPLFFELRQGEATLGVLPCYVFRPIPLLAMLHSLHWNLPGGPLLFDDRSHPEPACLSESIAVSLTRLATEAGWAEVKLHTSPFSDVLDSETLHQAGYTRVEERFTHVLDVRGGFESVWKAYNKRVRGAVRKAEKNGVSVRITESEEAMRVFYAMYVAMMRHFGSPPKPYSLLRALQVSEMGHLTIAEHEGRIIGGLLFLHFHRGVTLWVEASLPDCLHLRTNNALIHFIIRWACERGCHWVDFGASPPERKGLVAFKEEWRAERQDFVSYRRVFAPRRLAWWARVEPTLRRVYSWMQGRGHANAQVF